MSSIQVVGVAPQTNTVLKNWFENERLEIKNSYRAQQRPRILLSSRRARISGEKVVEGTDRTDSGEQKREREREMGRWID